MLKRGVLITLLSALWIAVTPANTLTHKIDVNHSNVGFAVPILGGLSKVRGKFTEFTVSITHDEKEITKSSVTATIKTASISTGITGRDAHLRTADFFDAEKYPEITFHSTRIEKRGKQLLAHGTFTMHGVSKEVALPFTITGRHLGEDQKGKFVNVGYAVRWKLNRRDFGINYTHQVDATFIGDDIDIEIDLITRATALP